MSWVSPPNNTWNLAPYLTFFNLTYCVSDKASVYDSCLSFWFWIPQNSRLKQIVVLITNVNTQRNLMLCRGGIQSCVLRCGLTFLE